MRFDILSLISLISIVSAAIEDNVPACALKCIKDNANPRCLPTNDSWFICYCGDPKWLKVVVDCAASTCSPSDWSASLLEGYQGCSAAGYKLASPSVVTTAIGANVGSQTLPSTIPGITFASSYPNTDSGSASGSSSSSANALNSSNTPPTSKSATSSSNSTGSNTSNPKGAAEKLTLGSIVGIVLLGMIMV